ncbi:hypothetical protein Syun_007072 [Stephania yunnanensis]|uniref:beta-ketoacyl-[acyl-carrier-protein] synthase I n=1 Tax=Stephania yunnanensis TaxID=152371 RepID=A0AAP0KY00_9MAGN
METICWKMVYCLSLTSAHLTLSIFIASPRQQAVTDDHPRRRRPPSSSLSLLTATRRHLVVVHDYLLLLVVALCVEVRTGVVLCIENALVQSGVSREDVNYINAHATSTQAGDIKEYQALIRCFGHNPELNVNSTKSMIGHLLGVVGLFVEEAVQQDSS